MTMFRNLSFSVMQNEMQIAMKWKQKFAIQTVQND